MIVKALLAWAGLRAAPCFHDMRVHDAMNADAAVISGVRVLTRQSMAVARTIATDPGDAGRIVQGVDRLQSIMSEVARRADP